MTIGNVHRLCPVRGMIQENQEVLRKVKEWATAGLLTDEGHHKQYCLEQILVAIDIDLGKLRIKLNKDDYDWEPGVAP